MDFGIKKPCAKCPFKRQGGVALTAARAREIAGMMLHSQGGTFACHETTTAGGERGDKEQHCAGALIFALKNETLPQYARIAERLGEFNGDELVAQPCAAEVFDTAAEMVREHGECAGKTGRRRAARKVGGAA